MDGGYELKEVSAEVFSELYQKHAGVMFADEQIFRLRDGLSKKELNQWDELNQKCGEPIKIYLGAYFKGELIGWMWGWQESGLRFYMCNSVIFPAHRRKGVYTALMNEMVRRVLKLGFQEIFSRHTLTNNSVLIAKLKAGFVITSFEVSDLFGALVVLSYLPNPLRKKMLDYRVGQIKPDVEIKKYLNF